jgi:hypothetical protein
VKVPVILVVAIAASLLANALTDARAQTPSVEIVAEYPAGTFLENLDVLGDGRVVFTSYFAKTVEMLDKNGKARTFAKLSAHPVSILAVRGGFLVAAHGQPFVAGPAFIETQQFLLLDRNGAEIASFKAPEARFLNGMVRHVRGTVLVADSIAAMIWQVDPTARTIMRWLNDAALAQDPTVKEFRPGANGLKRQGSRLMVSNSSRGTLLTVAVDAKGAASGPITELAKVGPIDDFIVGPRGEVVFTTHGATLLRRAADGSVTTLMASGCDGCTAVALAKGRGAPALIVLTTGGFSEGRKAPARVLRLPYR